MTVKKENVAMTNKVLLTGVVTFVKSYGKVANVGIITTYEDNGKEFKTSNTLKIFEKDIDKVIKKGDTINIEGHFITRKYEDKFFTEIIVDVLS